MSTELKLSDTGADLNPNTVSEPQAPAPNAGIDIRPIPRISVQGFCLSDNTSRTIEIAAEDRRMAKAHVKVHMGGIPAAVEFYAQAPTPNLIIVEAGNE
ncbi:MAG: CtpF protein, partial [Roseibium sp.]